MLSKCSGSLVAAKPDSEARTAPKSGYQDTEMHNKLKQDYQLCVLTLSQ